MVQFSRTWTCLSLPRQLLGLVLLLLFQTPCYFLVWLDSLVRLPLVLWRGGKATDIVIIDFIEHTALSMFSEQVEGTPGLWKLEVKCCELVMAGKPLNSFCLFYKSNYRWVTTAAFYLYHWKLPVMVRRQETSLVTIATGTE